MQNSQRYCNQYIVILYVLYYIFRFLILCNFIYNFTIQKIYYFRASLYTAGLIRADCCFAVKNKFCVGYYFVEGFFVKNVLFGLTSGSSNEEIQAKVFEKAHEARYFSMATLPAHGNVPGCRYLDFMTSASDGLIYFGVGTGKFCDEDITASPVVTLCGAFVGDDTGFSEHRSLISFRISGLVKEADNQLAVEEYWKRNPGSKKMWEGSEELFKIYCLYKGEGELYQVYANDKIYRLRFCFGGALPRPFRYQINGDKCIGCGACARSCTAHIINLDLGKANIPYHHCFECGKCYFVCPNSAIDKIELSEMA